MFTLKKITLRNNFPQSYVIINEITNKYVREGFEIINKKIRTLFLVLVLVFALAGIAEASVGTKQVKVNYNNINIMVDGKPVTVLSNQEPFMLNNVTYVPLRVAGQALGSYVNWQGETKTISITSQTTAQVSTLTTQISQKEKEIEDLKKQVADLEWQLREAETSASDLRDLEDDLLDDYDSLENVYIEDIFLDGDEDDVDVTIEVDLDNDGKKWRDLSDRDIENWIEDLVDDIQDELSEDTEIDGEIIDIDSDDVLVEFNKDGDDRLDIDFEDEDYRGADVDDVIDDLDGKTYDVGDLEFSISDVDYDENDDEVTVDLEAEDNDASSVWDDITTSTLESYIEYIGEDIADTFDEDANVTLDIVKLYFYDENLDELDDFEYDVDDQTLDY